MKPNRQAEGYIARPRGGLHRGRLLLAGLLLVLAACAPLRSEPAVPLPSTPWATRVASEVAQGAGSPTSGTDGAMELPPATVAATSPAALPPTPATLTEAPSRPPLPTETSLPPTATPLPPTVTPVPPTPNPPTATLFPTATSPPPTATVAPAAGLDCYQPPDDYTRVVVRGHTVSQRTYRMLQNAQALYQGRGSMFMLIQGSYAPGLGASFGTHDGGGAVDIWMVDPDDTSQVLTDIPDVVRALRQSGFAAWFRPANMLYQGMYPHVHAIAIGDSELSAAAHDQLYGPHGYFAGQNGLPEAEFAGADPHGGPYICSWMEPLLGGIGEAVVAPVTVTPAALACQTPVEDYSRVTVNGHVVNRRTYLMLETAQHLYGGVGNLLWVTQGSYTGNVSASFGTHDGGGAVDISIRHPDSGEFLYDEVESMVWALRRAGFAAWYRSEVEGYAPHIHAIAVGDTELSEAARAQLEGEQGYFRGRNGLPQPEVAGPDRHGGPLVCDWMAALGYGDWRDAGQ